ncbi:MAG: helix-turn-helix domain-containing protein [Patescibacteria group bacterium]
MKDSQFLSTIELAEIMGISRIAVFKKIKSGEIRAQKVGRNYIIDKKDVFDFNNTEPTTKDKQVIDQAVKRTVKEYGETLKLLGKT